MLDILAPETNAKAPGAKLQLCAELVPLLQRPLADYFDKHEVASDEDFVSNVANSMESLNFAIRTVKFINLTGLRASQDWGEAFDFPDKDNWELPEPNDTFGIDLWERDGQYLVTTEPYDDHSTPYEGQIEAWCQARGWSCVRALGASLQPSFPGWLLNPDGGLYLCAPPKRGLDVEDVAQAMDQERDRVTDAIIEAWAWGLTED